VLPEQRACCVAAKSVPCASRNEKLAVTGVDARERSEPEMQVRLHGSVVSGQKLTKPKLEPSNNELSETGIAWLAARVAAYVRRPPLTVV
jgi:hypothetical protein